MSKIKKLAVLCFMILLGSFVITNSVNAESKYFHIMIYAIMKLYFVHNIIKVCMDLHIN